MTYEQNYLAHFGIKGMKWGIRRFQNEDGTLTKAGKQRYGEDRPESLSWKKSEAKNLSDTELRRRNSRLQAEQQYRNLLTSTRQRESTQFLKNIAQEAIKGIFVTTAVGLAGKAMSKKYKKAGSVIAKYGKQALSKIKVGKMFAEKP